VLDTNALFLPVRSGFPLEKEVERLVPGATLVVPASVQRELESLVAAGTPEARAARELARRFRAVPSTGDGDDGVVAAAERTAATVVTADRELQRRLLAHGISVLLPRDRHRLELTRGRPAR
jgi:rRNA-processing protein FCF1